MTPLCEGLNCEQESTQFITVLIFEFASTGGVIHYLCDDCSGKVHGLLDWRKYMLRSGIYTEKEIRKASNILNDKTEERQPGQSK